MNLPESIPVDLAPTVFRKSAIHKTVTILSVDMKDGSSCGYVWYDLVVACEGKTFKVEASVRTDNGHANAGYVHEQVLRFGAGDTGQLKTRVKHLRCDSGTALAIRRACEIFAEREFKNQPPVG